MFGSFKKSSKITCRALSNIFFNQSLSPEPLFSGPMSINRAWSHFMFCTPFRSFQSSRSVVSNSLWPHELQHARPPCPSATPRVYSNSCPWSWWCHPAISSSVIPFSSCPNPSQHQGLFQWVNSSHEVAKVLEFQHQHHSFQCTPRADLL